LGFVGVVVRDTEYYLHEAKGPFVLIIATKKLLNDIGGTACGTDALKREVYNK
jgi:hypothetical protein